MQKQDFRFFHTLRVRWAEVDMQKIVFNAHYLMYFDTAVADYWRALALPYEATMHTLGGDLYVVKSTVEYKGSARYDDLLRVGMRCSRMGTSSMVFTGAIFRGDELLITGELIYVYANPATQTSLPIPAALRAVIDAYERHEGMLEVRCDNWAQLQPDASAVRTEVFVEEQKISREEEWDAADASAIHAVAYNRLGVPLATGRLLQAAPQVAQIGRMAVVRLMRGQAFGAQVLQALMDQARARGDREVLLHAQLSAEAFYARQGFVRRGDVFVEAGIDHVEMVRGL